jgi:acyl-coenzyme A synthetase/AMP-(fatty) acid ligase
VSPDPTSLAAGADPNTGSRRSAVPTPPLSIPSTLPRLVESNGRELGSTPVMVNDDEVLTHAELDERSRALARRLLAAGVTKRSRIALLMPNGIEWLITSVAVMRIGAVLVPLSTLLRPPEVEAQLRTASATVLIAVRAYRGRRYLDELTDHLPGLDTALGAGARHPALPNLRHLWAADAVPTDAVADDLAAAMEGTVRPADDLAIMFTSGSRGTPKGVIHTHGGAIGATAAGLEVRCIRRGERLYIPMPFFWMGGFGGGLISVLVAGATLLTETDPSPASTIRFLERERATLFRGWPDQAATIAADPSFASADLRSLRPGSLDAVLPADLRAAPGARANLFGMTESFGPYCGSRLDTDLPVSARGSCGRPFAGVEVRITDPETGAPVACGEQGAIEIRGTNMMRGICGRLREDTFLADGSYATGDLGRLDQDGYLFYGGRTDDMFKVSGATVFPTEVEAALRSLDVVRQAFVTNVEGPDGNDLVGAAVVTIGSPSVDEVAAAARVTLSSFKVPKRWALVSSTRDVPMLASGKVDKAGLQALIATDGQTATRGAPTPDISPADVDR